LESEEPKGACRFAGSSCGEANCTNPGHFFFSIGCLRGVVPETGDRARKSTFSQATAWLFSSVIKHLFYEHRSSWAFLRFSEERK
jgi:hypothetical protein